MRERMRARHSLRAMAASQEPGSRGRNPPVTQRCAARKTCWVASSASTGSRSSRRQRPKIIRPCARKRSPAEGTAAPEPGRPFGKRLELVAVGVAVSSVVAVVTSLVAVVSLVVVVFLVVVFALLVLVRNRLGACEIELELDGLAYE